MIIFYQNAVGLFCILAGFVLAQKYLDDECTLRSSGLPGVCKLFNDCPVAVKGLREQNRHPQGCSFTGSQSIVCCPNEEITRKPGEISKQKCEEYAEYVKEIFRPPIGLIDVAPITKNECGHKVVPLIVGGEKASRKEFPHMAAIGYGSNIEDVQWSCGGTILSDKYILTAAHCFDHQELGEPKWVKLGSTKLNSTFRRQHIEIAEIIAYPEYRSYAYYHDIGLIKLKKSAYLNSYARPACLYLKNEIFAEKAIATGWGKTSWNGEGSNDLLKVALDIFDQVTCGSSYKRIRKLREGVLDDLQVCAGSVDRKNDTCQGDSGGPLQIYHIGDNIKCMYDIIGITSFGSGCFGLPGVYTRVSYYIKWIEDIVWP